ncbi:YbhB/YbcL family Raf kinase inhibitor-like protein [Pseudomonas sp. Pseusp122]|uniref:YbhB/YbcL family Raf kinase inhibitor-like protein n=1 Tax=unclassified Pseudomonas TaxID=196821 RepID=UPI0039A5FC68
MQGITRYLRRHWLVSGALLLGLTGVAEAGQPFNVQTPGAGDGAFFSRENASNVGECGGDNISPALRWDEVPVGTRSFALILQDPDGQKGLGVDHWVHYGLPADVRELARNVGGEGKLPGVGGKNTRGVTTYLGPCPPVGDSPHHYVIQLYALDLAPDAIEAGLTSTELRARLKGHVLGNTSVVRRYQR